MMIILVTITILTYIYIYMNAYYMYIYVCVYIYFYRYEYVYIYIYALLHYWALSGNRCGLDAAGSPPEGLQNSPRLGCRVSPSKDVQKDPEGVQCLDQTYEDNGNDSNKTNHDIYIYVYIYVYHVYIYIYTCGVQAEALVKVAAEQRAIDFGCAAADSVLNHRDVACQQPRVQQSTWAVLDGSRLRHPYIDLWTIWRRAFCSKIGILVDVPSTFLVESRDTGRKKPEDLESCSSN